MHVLVTGGAGFIGSHVVEHHLKQGDEVHVIDDLSTGTQQNVDIFLDYPNYRFINANLLIYPEIQALVDWAERIYHFAAVVGVFKVLNDPKHVLSINIGATERLLRAAKASNHLPRIIIASTSEIYGNDPQQKMTEDIKLILSSDFGSRTTYIISKIAAESFGLAYQQEFDIPITILRFFNTIGPRQIGNYGMVVPRFIKAALSNKPITVFGTGKQIRSFIDIRDTLGFVIEVADNLALTGKTLNVGQDQPISINDLAFLVKKLTLSESKIEHISYFDAYHSDFEDCMFRKPDLTKLYQHTVYRPQWTLEKTLNDLIIRSQSSIGDQDE